MWKLRYGWRRGALDRELAEEMRFHLDQLEQEHRAPGAARREFGNVGLLMEDSRSAWGWRWAENFVQDLRFAGRAFRRDWTSSVAAVTALALGTGLAIAIFTIVNAVLLQPLPYKDPDRLVMVWAVNKQLGWDQEKISGPEMLDWQRSGLFEGVVGFGPNMTSITGPGEPELTHGYAVTAGFLHLLGVQPMLGRAFSSDEEKKGGDHKVILLRHSFWMRRYGGDRNVIGQKILVQKEPYTIVGVMSPEFQFFNRQTDLYIPNSSVPEDMRGRGRSLRLVARLKPGISLAQAQVRADALSAQFARDYPDSNRGWTVNLVPLPLDTTGPVRPALWVLLAAVGMVLLIACANVANLLLAQGISREQELSLRMALGAGRGRVMRQLLTESLMLAAAGGLAGYGLAHIAVQYFGGTLPRQYSFGRFLIQMERIHIDGWVAIFAAVVVPLAAVLVGLAPAWKASRPGLAEAFRGGRASGAMGARRLQNILVGGELALSVILVVGAALLAQSFERLYQQGPGFQPAGLKSMYVNLPTFEFQIHNNADWQRVTGSLWQRVMTSVKEIPGVESVAAVSHLPLAGFYYLTDLEVEGYQASRDNQPQGIDRYVSNSYHETMAVPLRQGRYFSTLERQGGPPAVIVNEQFARRYFVNTNPVGRRLRYAGGSNNPWYAIVGVSAGEPAGGMEEEPKPMVYFSMDQSPWPLYHLIVKSRMDLDATVNAVKQALHKISPSISPYEIRSLDVMVLDSTWRVRYSMMLLTALAAVALVLAALGVYGVLRYAVGRRTREIGIRMALGAQSGSILRMVVGDGLKVAVAGVLVGIAGACLLTRFLSTLLFGVRPIEPLTFAVVCGFLLLVAACSCIAPAIRAAALPPVEALRQE
jgi:putative ABC transport system permease protein